MFLINQRKRRSEVFYEKVIFQNFAKFLQENRACDGIFF